MNATEKFILFNDVVASIFFQVLRGLLQGPERLKDYINWKLDTLNCSGTRVVSAARDAFLDKESTS